MSGLRLILFLTCLTLCNTQAPPGSVFTFNSATWNSDGPRWNQVASLLTNEALSILAIQEAGSNNMIVSQTSRPPNNIPISVGGFNVQDPSLTESIWTFNGQTFYVYYYDMRLPGSRGTSKQNMALISKERASEVIIIPNEVRNAPVDADAANNYDRTFINRPVLGIVVRNSIFFDLHAEPNRRNEAPLLLDSIEEYLQDYHPQHTWMVMGDFNRTPQELSRDSGNFQAKVARGNRFFSFVTTGTSTRSSRNGAQAPAELDYGIVGGPRNYAIFAQNMRANLVTLASNPSDHVPVKFT